MANTPAAKKQKTDTVIDLETLKKQWTPLRELRHLQGTCKIESSTLLCIKKEVGTVSTIPARGGGPLVGGDWLLNKDGGAATISFFFRFEGKTYGLSVGHLVRDIGDPVFCFSETTKLPNPSLPKNVGDQNPEDLSDESYFMHEIGTVVSLSKSTDSMVFEVNGEVEVGEPYQMSPKSGVLGSITLKLPDVRQVMPPPPPVAGTDLVGFGAQHRGAHGAVKIPSARIRCDHSKKGNIGMAHPDDDSKKLTDAGDCGTVFFSLDGTAQYFHHCARKNGAPLISYGYPMWEVLKSHTHLGGTSEAILEEEDEEELVKECASVASPGGDTGPERCLSHFSVQVVDPPPMDVERSLCNFMDPNIKIICG